MAPVLTAEICNCAQNARDLAMRGDYDNSSIYYGSLLTKLQQFILSISDPMKKGRWISVRERCRKVAVVGLTFGFYHIKLGTATVLQGIRTSKVNSKRVA